MFVEEHKISSNHVEKIERMPRAPFEKKSLDLSIFTFNEELNDKLIEENVNAKSSGETIKDGIILVDDHVGDDFESDTRTSVLIGCDKKFFIWNDWKKHKKN